MELFDNKAEIMAIRESKMVGPLIVYSNAPESYADFDRYNKLISGNFAVK